MIRNAFVLFCLALPALAAAQEVTDPSAIRERVSALQDPAEVRRVEAEHRNGRNTSDALTAGFAALQLWQLTGEKEHAARSRRYFDRVAESDPANPWGHFGHALSFAPDIELKPGLIAADDAIGRALGLNAVSRARRALERAVQLDPSLPGAAELLARYAVATDDDAALELARERLAQQAAVPDAGADVLLALARTEREIGDYAAALDAADEAVARGGSTLAAAHLERAAALASLPASRPRAAEAYAAALAAADSTALDVLWRDASILAQPAEVQRWQRALGTEAKRNVLRGFWQVRGALAASSADERAAEHYARLNFAAMHFKRHGQLGAAPGNALRLQMVDPRFNDVGIIFIRHGHPWRMWDRSLADYIIWYYQGENGGVVSYHFQVHAGTSGYSKDPILIRRLPCLEPDAALFDPRLRPLTYGCNSMRIESVSAAVRHDAEHALRTDSDLPEFQRDIDFAYDIYTFRGQQGRTDVVAGIGVPVARLRNRERQLRFSLAIADTARFSADQTRATGTPGTAADADALLRAQLALSMLPAPAAAYRVDVREPDARAGRTIGGTLRVPDYSGSEPMISDLVLAHAATDGSFHRAGHRLALAPTQAFPGGSFRIFYELYNLPADMPFRTEIRIEPVDRSLARRLLGRGDRLSVSFEENTPASPETTTLPQLRDVVAPVEPGVYRIRVRVTSPAWKTAIEQERRFTVPQAEGQ